MIGKIELAMRIEFQLAARSFKNKYRLSFAQILFFLHKNNQLVQEVSDTLSKIKTFI